MAAKAWDEAREAQARAGIIVAGSPEERELLRVLDSERDDELYELHQSAEDRRASHEEHWHQRVGGRKRPQQYVPHPAKAMPP
jgi:Ni,Fe-hydrogenase III component G